MDRSTVSKCLCGILLITSCAQASTLPSGFDELSVSGELSLAELDAGEMEATEGSLAALPLIAFAIFSGATTGAITSAANQYAETGEVKPGKVVFGALVGAGLAAINAGAAITRNMVVMTTALGIDIAATASMAFAEDPTLADDGVLYRWEPGAVNANGVSYEQLQRWPYILTAAGEVSGLDGPGIPLLPKLEVDNSALFPLDSFPDPYSVRDPAGAGEDHYRYF